MMRNIKLVAIFAVPLALVACGAGEKSDGATAMPMSMDNMQMGGNMAMGNDNMPAMMSDATGQTASSEGKVTNIDAKAGTITISHGAIPAMNWPAMTMAFVTDAPTQQKVAVGDDVNFKFRKTETGGEIISISKN